MSDFVYNIALGKVAEKVADGATIKLLVLKAADADATLKDLDTVELVLAEAGTTEADFDNYARATLANLAVDVDDTGDKVDVNSDDVVFTAAGGTTDNTTTDVIIYEEVTNDADSIPLVQLDAVFTTDGNDVTLQFATDGWYSAS